MGTMTTVTEVINKLQKEGYTVDFNLKGHCLECHENALQIYPMNSSLTSTIVLKDNLILPTKLSYMLFPLSNITSKE